MSEPVAWPECEEFYGMMQAYRHSPLADQAATVEKYESVKDWLRDEIERKDAAIAELVGALRPFAANRFSAEDWFRATSAEDWFRASDVVAKYKHE